MRRERLLVVCGPTAAGKTGAAIALAARFDGEIVNADSRQVYRYMDIGTAKPTVAQRAAAPHHLLDVVDPDEPFTLADYLDRARAAVAAIAARGRLPILVGGTGLYVRALAQGFAVPRVPPNAALRAEVEVLFATQGHAALLTRLRAADAVAAATVDPHNPRRLMRAIEVAESRRIPSSDALSPGAHDAGTIRGAAVEGYDALVVGLTAERAILHARADRRVDAMMAEGFLEEVAALYARGYNSDLPSLSSLGYRELGESVRGERPLAEAVQDTKYATHRLIRRQLTWFRREPGLRWVDITERNLSGRISDMVDRWLPRQPPDVVG